MGWRRNTLPVEGFEDACWSLAMLTEDNHSRAIGGSDSTAHGLSRSLSGRSSLLVQGLRRPDCRRFPSSDLRNCWRLEPMPSRGPTSVHTFGPREELPGASATRSSASRLTIGRPTLSFERRLSPHLFFSLPGGTPSKPLKPPRSKASLSFLLTALSSGVRRAPAGKPPKASTNSRARWCAWQRATSSVLSLSLSSFFLTLLRANTNLCF